MEGEIIKNASKEDFNNYKKNEKSVKELVIENLKKYAGKELKINDKNLNLSKVSDEKILQSFAIIDVHTKIFEQMSAINSYNQIVQTISSLLVTTENWNESIEKCTSIIEDYYSVYIDDDKIDQNNKEQVEFCANIKKYVIDNCLLLLAIKNKDKELLGSLNKSISKTLGELSKTITGPVRPSLTNEKIDMDEVNA